MKFVLAAVIAASSCISAHAGSASGRYGSILLVVEGDAVQGVFTDARTGNGTGDAPQFTCEFLFKGVTREGSSDIEARSLGGSEAIAGRVALSGGALALRLHEAPDGCLMTSGDMVNSDFKQKLNTARPDWIAVALVTARRAVLSTSPGAPSASGRSVTRGDAVAVLKRVGAWSEVERAGSRRVERGWIRDTDIAAADAGP